MRVRVEGGWREGGADIRDFFGEEREEIVGRDGGGRRRGGRVKEGREGGEKLA